MPKNVGSIVVKLLIFSFFVGWLLTLFDITPDQRTALNLKQVTRRISL